MVAVSEDTEMSRPGDGCLIGERAWVSKAPDTTVSQSSLVIIVKLRGKKWKSNISNCKMIKIFSKCILGYFFFSQFFRVFFLS